MTEKKQELYDPGTPIYVKWHDSATSAGWTRDTDTAEPGLIMSAGIVVTDQRPKAIKITTSVSGDGPVLSPLVIPGTAILDIGRLEVFNEMVGGGTLIDGDGSGAGAAGHTLGNGGTDMSERKALPEGEVRDFGGELPV